MGGDDNALEAADAAARLRAWFEAEGTLVMDEADFDDVQTVLADYGRVLAENERLREELERLTPRTVTCPTCQRPTKLTTTGLFRFHGPHSRPCRASGTHPAIDAAAAPQRPTQSNGAPGCLCPHTYQPDGALVRDGVLAAGCPVHDPDEGPTCGG